MSDRSLQPNGTVKKRVGEGDGLGRPRKTVKRIRKDNNTRMMPMERNQLPQEARSPRDLGRAFDFNSIIDTMAVLKTSPDATLEQRLQVVKPLEKIVTNYESEAMGHVIDPLVGAGGVKFLRDCVKSSDNMLQMHALSILSRISVSTHHSAQMISFPFIDIFLAVLDKGRFLESRMYAAAILGNLALSFSHVRYRILDNKGPSLVGWCITYAFRDQERGDCSIGQITALVDIGIFLLQCLCFPTSDSDEPIPPLEKIRPFVVLCNALIRKHLENRLSIELPETALNRLLQTLSAFAAGSDDHAKAAVENGAIQNAMGMIKHSRSSPSIRRNAVQCIGDYIGLKKSDVIDLAINAGFLAYVVDELPESIQPETVFALRGIATGEGRHIKALVEARSLVEVIFSKVHNTGFKLRCQAAYATCNLFKNSSNLSSLSRRGGLEALLAVVKIENSDVNLLVIALEQLLRLALTIYSGRGDNAFKYELTRETIDHLQTLALHPHNEVCRLSDILLANLTDTEEEPENVTPSVGLAPKELDFNPGEASNGPFGAVSRPPFI